MSVRSDSWTDIGWVIPAQATSGLHLIVGVATLKGEEKQKEKKGKRKERESNLFPFSSIDERPARYVEFSMNDITTKLNANV